VHEHAKQFLCDFIQITRSGNTTKTHTQRPQTTTRKAQNKKKKEAMNGPMPPKKLIRNTSTRWDGIQLSVCRQLGHGSGQEMNFKLAWSSSAAIAAIAPISPLCYSPHLVMHPHLLQFLRTHESSSSCSTMRKRRVRGIDFFTQLWSYARHPWRDHHARNVFAVQSQLAVEFLQFLKAIIDESITQA
jgi:hypothetical protein